jgi:CheY-like chemotaxis protein
MNANEERNPTMTRKPNILIVEDDDQIRGLLCAILETCGYSVRPAQDGMATLEELRTDIPDVFLSDLNMPRTSSLELLPMVRQQFPRTRVLAMNSAFSGSDIPAGVAADTFYEKASDVVALLQVIETMACPDPSRYC